MLIPTPVVAQQLTTGQRRERLNTQTALVDNLDWSDRKIEPSCDSECRFSDLLLCDADWLKSPTEHDHHG